MTRILIGNDFSEDVRTDRGWTGWWVQRLIWFAEAGDVLVLPSAPDADFFAYAATAKGLQLDEVAVVTPPGRDRDAVLNAEVLGDPALAEAVRAALGGRPVEEILPLWPDVAVARLARRLGLTSALPGAAFMSQAGGVMVNSKAAFRTVAAGAGVPLPDGAVCTSRAAAVTAVTELLESHDVVVVKHEWMSGGRGNELLSLRDDVRPIGARRSVRVSSDADVERYFAERWDWLSAGGRGRPVAEHYFEDSSAFFTELLLDEKGSHFRGDGELLSAPYAVGQIMPAPLSDPGLHEELVEHSHALAEAVRAMGYRGNLGPDAIVTPDDELFFTEWNGRVTGSTHIYEEIGRKVVGPGFGSDRLILERVWPQGWSVPSFADALRRLEASGRAFSPETRTGVVLTNAHDGDRGVMYCVAAPSIDEAWEIDRGLAEVFGDPHHRPAPAQPSTREEST